MRSFIVFAIAALAGCGASSGEQSGTTDSSIINGGTSPSTAWYNAVALPGCSAVALDEEWVLTARHCTCGGSLAWPCTTSLTVGSSVATRVSPNESRVLREVHQYPNADLALLRVQPFSAMANHNQPWGGPMSGLVGKDLYCLGQGDNVAPFGGFGTWRDATMRIGVAGADGYTLYPNAQGQIQWMGDSGGPCIYQTSQTSYVTGIQSTATWECASPWFCDRATAVRVTSTYQAGLTAAATDWLRDARERSPLFFYDNGVGYVSMLERRGGYTSMHDVQGFSSNWTHVVVLHDDALFFYDANSGTAATATLDKWGNYRGGAIVDGFAAPGYTHVVAVGADGVFLYDANGGVGVTARVDGTGAFTQGETIDGFSSWTHVAATRDGGLFFYDSNGGVGATATVDANLHYTYIDTITGFSTGFTHVTGVDHGGLFFYSASSGVAYASQIDIGGHYHSYGPVPGLPAGYTFVVGASNAGLLLLDDRTGTATVARVDTGRYSYVGTVSGFGHWTTVSAN